MFRYECGDDGCEPVGRRELTIAARFEGVGRPEESQDVFRLAGPGSARGGANLPA